MFITLYALAVIGSIVGVLYVETLLNPIWANNTLNWAYNAYDEWRYHNLYSPEAAE